MALSEEEEHAVFDDDADLEDTEGDDREMEDADDDEREAPPPPPVAGEENLNSSTPSTSTSSDPTLNPNPNPKPKASGPPAVPENVAIPAPPLSAAAPATADLFTPPPSRKRRRTSASDEKKPSSLDDSRRLFQRLWTDEDEITILQGFLEFTSQRGTTHASHQYDTGPFYDQIKKRLQLDFNKNQLIEKLRRLKKKYRNAENRMGSSGKEFVFKAPHDKATYEISKKIWCASIKSSLESDDDDHNYFDAKNINTPVDSTALNSKRSISRSQRRGRKRCTEESAALAAAVKEEPTAAPPMPCSSAPASIPNIIEETVKSCLSPLFKEILEPLGSGLLFHFGGNPVNPLGLAGSGAGVDEKWRKQHILELEVYLKRTELVRDQIKSTLEELRSSASDSC